VPDSDARGVERYFAEVPRTDIAFHSITWSARARSVAGISKPSVLAVLRLVISSSPVGYHTAAFRRLVLASRVGHAFVTRRDAKFTAAGLRAV
jgi:hypothetical protein